MMTLQEIMETPQISIDGKKYLIKAVVAPFKIISLIGILPMLLKIMAYGEVDTKFREILMLE